MQNLLFEAIVKKFEAQKLEAQAVLSVYFTNPVGIGEHPDLLAEIQKYVLKLAEAEGALESLQRNFVETESDGN
jgi:hypothetical protein